MKLPWRRRLHPAAVAVAVVWSSLSGHGALSQAARTIKIVVPVSPGVGDFLARVLAEQVGRAQGKTVLVENRAGAGGGLDAEGVSRAVPDGKTLLFYSPDLLISSVFGS